MHPHHLKKIKAKYKEVYLHTNWTCNSYLRNVIILSFTLISLATLLIKKKDFRTKDFKMLTN